MQAGEITKNIVTARTTTEYNSGPRNYPLSKTPDLRIIVLTMDRHLSLQRLLESLGNAHYGKDEHIDLDIWIDRPRGGGTHSLTMQIAKDFGWNFGTKRVHKRLENAGLYEQWIYTWGIDKEKESDEIAVILEDDLQVSPYFWVWLRAARAAYAGRKDVGAFTLQRGTLRAKQIRGVASGPLRIPPGNLVYMYKLLGTWGFSPTREVWIRFREWYEEKRRNNEKPYVKGLTTTNWYKSQEINGVAHTMWSQWWIKFVDEMGLYTVYAHLPNRTTLAANWREKGMHYSKRGPSRDFNVFDSDTEEIYQFPENPLKLDWDGRPVRSR